jgi:hypothetical protein
MSDDAPSPATWREPIIVFTGVLAALFILTVAGNFWAPLGNNIVAAAAAIFLFVPYFILRRQGADFRRFGIDLDEIPLRQVGLGLAVTLLIFPLFAIGNHYWESEVLEREFDFLWDNYRKWSVDLEVPEYETDQQLVQVYTVNERLRIDWDNTEQPLSTFRATMDRPGYLRAPCEMNLSPGGPSTEYECTPPPSMGRRMAISLQRYDYTGERVELPHHLRVEIDTPVGADPPKVLGGNKTHDADEPIELKRTHWWLLLWGLTHLLLIALPEEYFYRGYLQTKFGDLLADEHGDPRKFLGLTWANWLTSAFFAIGHLLIPVGGTFSPARGAVFFPSLLFGWLRDRTGSIVASVVFHAGANMMVLIVAVHYWSW